MNSLKMIRWDWVAYGWFMAVALASLLLLGMNALGVIGETPGDESLGVALALVIGFLTMGFFIGTRVVAAPVLHGIGMALISGIAWFLVNLFAEAVVGGATWWPVAPMTILSLFGLQAIAAVLGARVGVRRARGVR
jgi:hypothetical protein